MSSSSSSSSDSSLNYISKSSQYFIYEPNWDDRFTTTYTYQSVVTQSRYGLRQKTALNSNPVVSYQYRALLHGDYARYWLKQNKTNTSYYYVPNWGIGRSVSDVTIGANYTIQLTERNIREDLAVGDKIVIYGDQDNWDVATIASLSDQSTFVVSNLPIIYWGANHSLRIYKLTKMLVGISDTDWLTSDVLQLSVSAVDVAEYSIAPGVSNICSEEDYDYWQIPPTCVDTQAIGAGSDSSSSSSSSSSSFSSSSSSSDSSSSSSSYSSSSSSSSNSIVECVDNITITVSGCPDENHIIEGEFACNCLEQNGIYEFTRNIESPGCVYDSAYNVSLTWDGINTWTIYKPIAACAVQATWNAGIAGPLGSGTIILDTSVCDSCSVIAS